MTQLPTVGRTAAAWLPTPDNRMRPLAAVVTAEKIYHSDPETMSGTPVFVGTRVPVTTLFDYLAAGDSIEAFLDDFPTVSKEKAVALLEFAKETLRDHAPTC